jgi:hypothetical protein
VNDNAPDHSGSRWEPPPAGGTAPVQPHASDADRPTRVLPPPAWTAAETGAAGRGARSTGGRRARRGLLAGVGAGLFLIGGVGGFAAGSAAAGDGSTGLVPSGTTGTAGTGADGHRGPRGDDGLDGFGDALPSTDEGAGDDA